MSQTFVQIVIIKTNKSIKNARPLEKAVVLELTIKYIRQLQKSLLGHDVKPSPQGEFKNQSFTMIALYTQLLDKQSDRDFYFGWTTMRILFPITVTQIEFPDGVKGIRVTCSELVFEIKDTSHL